MEYARLLHPNKFDARINRFTSVAFKNSSGNSGVSLSIVNVSGRLEAKFAITPEHIMQAKLANRQFTGNSMIPYFPTLVE